MNVNKLKSLVREADKRINANRDVLRDCISSKLNRSLEEYERKISKTYEYILRRRPIIMMKDFNILFKH